MIIVWSDHATKYSLIWIISEEWGISLLHEKEEKINLMIYSKKFTCIIIEDAQFNLSLFSV